MGTLSENRKARKKAKRERNRSGGHGPFYYNGGFRNPIPEICYLEIPDKFLSPDVCHIVNVMMNDKKIKRIDPTAIAMFNDALTETGFYNEEFYQWLINPKTDKHEVVIFFRALSKRTKKNVTDTN